MLIMEETDFLAQFAFLLYFVLEVHNMVNLPDLHSITERQRQQNDDDAGFAFASGIFLSRIISQT
jgi:hypothetical protein